LPQVIPILVPSFVISVDTHLLIPDSRPIHVPDNQQTLLLDRIMATCSWLAQ
jgi:hypothetical protein